MYGEKSIDSYKKEFEDFLREAEKLSSFFGDSLKSIEVKAVFNNLMEIRKELVKIFSETLGNLCKKCGGDCCKRYITFINEDILICRVLGFNFPTPQWNFLIKKTQEGKMPCLFLGEKGCSLKEFRPFVCLSYVAPWKCDPGGKILTSEKLNRIEKLLKKYRRHSFRGCFHGGD